MQNLRSIDAISGGHAPLVAGELGVVDEGSSHALDLAGLSGDAPSRAAMSADAARVRREPERGVSVVIVRRCFFRFVCAGFVRRLVAVCGRVAGGTSPLVSPLAADASDSPTMAASDARPAWRKDGIAIEK